VRVGPGFGLGGREGSDHRDALGSTTRGEVHGFDVGLVRWRSVGTDGMDDADGAPGDAQREASGSALAGRTFLEVRASVQRATARKDEGVTDRRGRAVERGFDAAAIELVAVRERLPKVGAAGICDQQLGLQVRHGFVQGLTEDRVDVGFALRHLQRLLQLGLVHVSESDGPLLTLEVSGAPPEHERGQDEEQNDADSAQAQPVGECEMVGGPARFALREGAREMDADLGRERPHILDGGASGTPSVAMLRTSVRAATSGFCATTVISTIAIAVAAPEAKMRPRALNPRRRGFKARGRVPGSVTTFRPYDTHRPDSGWERGDRCPLRGEARWCWHPRIRAASGLDFAGHPIA
jgi:hypothetical protein